MGSQVFLDLPQPTDEEEPDEELLEYLGQAHDDNPVSRDARPLMKYLDSCAILSYSNLYMLLNGIVEGPLLSHSSAQKLQVAVLAYFARTFGRNQCALTLSSESLKRSGDLAIKGRRRSSFAAVADARKNIDKSRISFAVTLPLAATQRPAQRHIGRLAQSGHAPHSRCVCARPRGRAGPLAERF